MIKKILQNTFKKIFYSFFTKIYGKIEKSINSEDSSRVDIKIVNIEKNLSYKVYKINKGRLYTDRIHDTAVIIDNKIVKGPSFQLRENNNSEINNNVVFQKGTPRILKNFNGVVLSLLTGGGGNNNYWHWLYDVLPRLNLCDQIKKIELIDYFLLPNLKRKFQQETLRKLEISQKKILSSENFRHIKADELIVTEHPYMLTNNAHLDAQNIPKWIINWLKDKFLSKSNLNIKNYPKNIYIDRSDSKSNSAHLRSLVNEDEIKKFLLQEKFTFIQLDKLSFTDQVNYFNNANFIVGLHGAGFANLSFCKNNTKVIEFRMENTGKVIENLAVTNSLQFRPIVCKPLSHTSLKHFGKIKIPINILEQKMNDLEKTNVTK